MSREIDGHEIDRRDFLNGMALVAAASALAPIDQLAAQTPSRVYPPALLGLRGSTDESTKVIHALALEGAKFDIDRLPHDEAYDLVVVGAGLAGLTAAWAFLERRPAARILVLDNNDDFGGQARRTEHTIGGRTIIGYGGSESLVAPAAKFKDELGRILRTLRIEPERFERERVFARKLYPGLGLSRAVFFNREHFGVDKLVTGDPLVLGYDEFAPNNPGGRPPAAFLADCPLSTAARNGLLELFAGTRDYLAGATVEAKLERLQKTSYRAFLTDICKLPAEAANVFQGRSSDNWGFGIDALGAIEMMGDGFPGAKALGIEDRTAGNPEEKAAYIHHYPDGNASIARALVRSMIRDVVPGVGKSVFKRPSMEALITERFDYGRLDRPNQSVRLRLDATVVRVRNREGAVDIGYVAGGQLKRVQARHAVMATSAAVMPYICPDIGPDAAELMRSNVKAPLVYTKVAVRNWESFIRLKTHRITAPMSFHGTVKLDYPVSFGRYTYDADPKRPTVLHLVHVPGEPMRGLDMRAQARAGRAKLLATPFRDFEQAVREDLGRMLGPGGFDAGRDISAITVNRWSHGYSYTPSSLYDDLESLPAKQEAMKARLGNIVFANSDTGWDAYAHTAMAEAVRAVGELTGEKPPPYVPRWSERFREVVRRAQTAAQKPPEPPEPAKK